MQWQCMNVCRTTQTNRPIIIPQCSHSRRSFLRTVGVHNTSPTTVQTYDDEARRDILSSPTCESSHHAKLMERFGDTLSFLTYFDNQSIMECPTVTGDEARAVLLNVQGDIGHYPGHVEQIVRREFQKWDSPFPSFASATVST